MVNLHLVAGSIPAPATIKGQHTMRISFIIKQQYFDQIISGEKKEEYRDYTESLLKKICQLDEDGNATDFKPIKEIEFLVGYQKNRKSAVVECLGIEVDYYQDDNGNPIEDDEYFVFSLGRVVSTNNVNH